MKEPKVGGRWVDGEWVETLGGIPVDNIPSPETPQEELVNAFSQGLRGETPVEGEDNSWSCIGGIKFGSKALVKSPSGDPIFVLTIQAAASDVKHNYANVNFPVLVKRAPDGGIERISIDFTETMEYSNLGDNYSKEEMKRGMEILAKLGLATFKQP